MIKTALTIFFLFSASNAMAAIPSAPAPDEILTLPAYCKAKLSLDPSDDIQYSGMIGPNWVHIHHYCFALNFTNRYYKHFDSQDRRYFLKNALDNYDYMFSHVTPDFWMLPEIHTEKGKLLSSAKLYTEAVGELEKALQGNPSYAEAYVALSDVYLNMDQKSNALTAVERGLQHVPDKKSLQRRYKLLTGKTFTPPQSTAEQEVQKNQPPISATETPVAQDAAISSVISAPVQTSPDVLPSNSQEKIGSPTNPYCRFCP